MKRVLMLASVASMIDQFNMPNIKLLLEMGYQVDVACNFLEGSSCSAEKVDELKRTLTSLGVACYQIDFSRSVFRLSENIKAYKQVKKIMKEKRYAFVHCHSPIGGVIARLAAKKTKTKSIYTAHGFHFYKGAPLKNWLLYYPTEKLCSRWTDALITINQEDYVLAQRKMKAKQIYIIPGIGIELNRFLDSKTDRIAIRKEFGIKESEKVLIYIAELNKNKNQISLIDMLAEVCRVRTDVKLMLVGRGDYEGILKTKSQKMGVLNQLIFTGYRKDIPDLLRASDIAVPSSIREGFGLNVVEAMACRVPVIAYDNRGHRTIIQDQKNGYLVLNGDYKAMARKVIHLLDNPNIAEEFANVAYTELGNYSAETVSKIMKNIYSDESL